MGDSTTLKSMRAQDFVTEDFGLPTVRDILSELEKPGRDPRPGFVTATLCRRRQEDRRPAPGHVAGGGR